MDPVPRIAHIVLTMHIATTLGTALANQTGEVRNATYLWSEGMVIIIIPHMLIHVIPNASEVAPDPAVQTVYVVSTMQNSAPTEYANVKMVGLDPIVAQLKV